MSCHGTFQDIITIAYHHETWGYQPLLSITSTISSTFWGSFFDELGHLSAFQVVSLLIQAVLLVTKHFKPQHQQLAMKQSITVQTTGTWNDFGSFWNLWSVSGGECLIVMGFGVGPGCWHGKPINLETKSAGNGRQSAALQAAASWGEKHVCFRICHFCSYIAWHCLCSLLHVLHDCLRSLLPWRYGWQAGRPALQVLKHEIQM